LSPEDAKPGGRQGAKKKTLCVSAPLRAKKNISKKKSSSSLLQLGGLSATADRQSPSKEKRLAREDAKAQRN
jgi:hypothetical protein